MIKKIFISLFGLALLYNVSAQDAAFTATAPATVRAGQQFQYTVKGNEKVQVELQALEGLEILNGPFPSYYSSTQWVNGRMTASTTATFTYIMRIRKEGSYTIPPALIKKKKSTIETNSVDINVIANGSPTTSSSQSNTQPANSTASSVSSGGTQTSATSATDSPVFLKLIPSKRNLYQGEQFVCELKVYTSVNTRPTGGLKEVPYEGFYKHALDADQTSQREIINGKEYVTQVLQRHVLIPQKSGKLSIEPFESEWTIPKKVKSRGNSMFDSFFDDPFFDSYQDVPVLISTSPVTINVKPLPNGAPAGFTGGVGNLKMTASLSADKATVNDAISLKIKISGLGNISLIGAPEIDFPPDHDVYETTKSLNLSTSGNKVSGSVTFEYPVVVRHAGSFRIAPIKFSYFDPSSESYKTMKSEEFSFVVQKGEGEPDEEQIFVSGSRGDEVQNIGTDILDIKRNPTVFQEINKSPLSRTGYWLIYVVLMGSFFLALFLLKKYYTRKEDVLLSRNRKANKLARKRMKSADKARKATDEALFFEETEKAIWGYLADKLSIELSSLSQNKVKDVLTQAAVNEAIQDELFRIIDDCEFSRYAPSSEKTNMDTLYKEAIALIHSLEQNINLK